MRDRVRNRFMRHVGELARIREDRGEWDEAVSCHERCLEVEPLAEGTYRRLMLCHRETGRRAEAMDVYDRCRSTFQAELGRDPSPETHVIFKTLLEP